MMAALPVVADLAATVLAQIDTQELLPRSGRLLLAISGGADSMALWDLIARCERWRVAVFHLDHGLRAESARDGELIRRQAERMGLTLADPLIIERSEIGVLARQWRCSLESAGRRQRYTRLLHHARALGVQAVLTAHHRDDQAETVLSNLLRGAGPVGAAGIPLRRRLAGGIPLVRPLLSLTRADLRAHCQTHGIAWNEDESNRDIRHHRNYLRHAVLPTLEQGVPGIGEALASFAVARQRTVLALDEVVEPVWVRALGSDDLLLDGIKTLSTGHRLEVWRRLVRHLDAPLARGHLRRLDDLAAGPAGRRLELGAWLLLRRPHAIAWERARPAISAEVVEIAGSGTVSRAGAQLRCSLEPVPDSLLCGPHEVLLASEACVWPLVWRAARASERWVPLGAPGRQTVVKFLSGRGVPSRLRTQAPVVADRNGVLWVPGYGIAERARVTLSTREIVRLRWTSVVNSPSFATPEDLSDERS